MKIIARHKWVSGAIITESYNPDNDNYRRFTATIRGWQNWKIYEGLLTNAICTEVKNVVKHIRDKIDSGDKEIFNYKGFFIDGIMIEKRLEKEGGE